MNKFCLLAYLNDWLISAQLVKLSTNHSYELKFYEDGLEIITNNSNVILIINIDEMSNDKFEKIKNQFNIKFILGYIIDFDKSKLSHYRSIGYDMVISYQNLLKNLESIIKQVTHAN